MFSIVFLCTGNLCRSPMAEAVLRDLAPGWVTVTSCGTLDMAGAEPPSETVRAAGRLGLDLTSHRSRHLAGGSLDAADLVVGFEHHHVAVAVVEGNASPQGAFTLPQLARLLRTLPSDSQLGITGGPEARARARLATVGASKAPFVPGEEVDDPIGRPQQVHEAVTARIRDLCEEIAAHLFT